MRVFSRALIAVFFWSASLSGGAFAQTAVPINISLTNYAFTPSALNFKVGTAYRLHFANNGSKGHNFDAPEFFAASQIEQADRGKIEDGSIELDSGQSIDITVIPGRAGTFAFDCSHFMHSMLGMHGKISVQ
jgi:plastocyanin